ncbi:unnamed protein product [Ceutorhynchus assimilis]|uniref:asparaginase n=1 Tax=Ceutorhynchus assimilis TaxID=467358 RepID=A0A9P0DGV5_9CUCU|nr:unnamed protein product [Ceutorhynchus assimilis]
MIQCKNVLVLYVGGTIGMQRNEHGVYVPVPNALFQKIKDSDMHDFSLENHLPLNLRHDELVLPLFGSTAVVYKIEEYKVLLDSSNMSTEDWIRISKDIEKNYYKFDGFVVLHGTDTLAFTASVLSFMLQNLQKPVIITGSQIPIFETRSDAKDNFLASLIFAGCYDIPEVCVCFANKLLRGNRTTKISSNLLNAFDSPNYHHLGNAGIEIRCKNFQESALNIKRGFVLVHQHYIRKKSSSNGYFAVNTSLNCNVGTLTFFPTITSSQLESFLKPPTEGLVLQTYGAGNIPSNNIKILQEAVNRGVIIVNVSQCSKGAVCADYEAGKVNS